MIHVKQIIFIFVVILLMIVALKVQITINDSNKIKEEKKNELSEIEHDNERKSNDLKAPVDDEYIEKVAEEKLDYKDPDKQYFYNEMAE